MSTRTETRYIVVHCSATEAGHDVGRAEIDGWHKARGWSGIGYHGVIRLDGAFEWGRDLHAVGAHTKGHNKSSIGLCLIGGLRDGAPYPTFNASQLKTLKKALDFFWTAWPGVTVLGHRDLSPDVNGDGIIDRTDWLKECPCFDVRHWLRTGEVLAEVPA